MYCNYCGKSIPDDANLCAYCGKRVGPAIPRGRLLRPHAGRKIAGVAIGMADYFDLDVGLMRLLWLLGAIVTFPLGELAYVIAWIVIPEAPVYSGVPVATVQPQSQPQ